MGASTWVRLAACAGGHGPNSGKSLATSYREAAHMRRTLLLGLSLLAFVGSLGSQVSRAQLADPLVTGGGIVLASPTPFEASFGVFGTSVVPPQSSALAMGHINYIIHANVAGNHVSVPVVLIAAVPTTTPGPNG